MDAHLKPSHKICMAKILNAIKLTYHCKGIQTLSVPIASLQVSLDSPLPMV